MSLCACRCRPELRCGTQRTPDFDLFHTAGTITPPSDTQNTLYDFSECVCGWLHSWVSTRPYVEQDEILTLAHANVFSVPPPKRGLPLNYAYIYTHVLKCHSFIDVLAEENGLRKGEDGRYRISNGAGMKRFLIFHLAAFQRTPHAPRCTSIYSSNGINHRCQQRVTVATPQYYLCAQTHTQTYFDFEADYSICTVRRKR